MRSATRALFLKFGAMLRCYALGMRPVRIPHRRSSRQAYFCTVVTRVLRSIDVADVAVIN